MASIPASATELDGVHFGGTGFAVAELIDPDSGDVLPFTDGQQGEVVYTSIRREASPLLRMRSHDVMQVFTEPCGCGRTSFRFQILGRSDDMFIVKGVNVFPLAIQTSLMSLAPRVTGEFRVDLDRPPPIDYAVPLSVEVAGDVPADRLADAGTRGGRAAAARPELHGQRHARPTGSDREGGQDASSHPQLSRGGRVVAVVEVEIKGDVALITLNRPEKLNAISVEMLDGSVRRGRGDRSLGDGRRGRPERPRPSLLDGR